jgi:hypothetical protein
MPSAYCLLYRHFLPGGLTCSPAVRVRGEEHRGIAEAGLSGSNVRRSKDEEQATLGFAASSIWHAKRDGSDETAVGDLGGTTLKDIHHNSSEVYHDRTQVAAP